MRKTRNFQPTSNQRQRKAAMESIYRVMFLISFGFCLISCSEITIYIGGFVELSTQGGWNSAGILPAIELATKHINQQPNILKDIELRVDMKDSKCSSAYTIKALVEHITSSHIKMAIVGPGCSISAKPVAESAHFWNLVQVAYGAGTSRLSDKTKYPLFFRVNSPEAITNVAIIALLKYFKWRKVAIVKQDVSIFNDAQEELNVLLRKNNISVISTNSFVNDPTNAVHDMLEKDARIIIALTYEKKCRQMLCAAYKQGLYGNHIQWLLRGWYEYRWWTINDTICSESDIRKVIGNYIGVEEKTLSTDERRTVSGMTPSELQLLYEDKAHNMSLPRNSYAPYAYDALWTIALALNQSIKILKKNNKTLADFKYNDSDMAAIFTSLVANTSFYGMSGLVEFEKNGDRINNLWIEQLQDEDETRVGLFESKKRQPSVDFIKLNNTFVWPDNKIPKSEPEIIETMATISRSLFITMTTLTCCGICMACGFLCFNVIHRTNSHIRMSSPQLNNLIIVGSLMGYTCVFLLGSSSFLSKNQLSIYRITCIMRTWLMACGFTLAFGTMFVKTWRVYKIFTNNNLIKELGYLHDRHLVMLLGLLLCVDILLLSAWQIFDPVQATILPFEKIPSSDNRQIYYSNVFQCESTHQMAWTVSTYSYKGLLLVFGLFLAWETRNVNFRPLNDSRYIGMSVYNVVLWACISVPLNIWVTKRSVNADFGLFAAAMNICVSSTLVLVFGPKVWTVKKVATSTIYPTDSKTDTEISKHTKRHAMCPGCKCK